MKIYEQILLPMFSKLKIKQIDKYLGDTMSRTIVITGGTSGIGLALKELFEKNGDTVITFSIDEAANSNHYQGSVSHEIKVNQVFNDIHEKYGAIDMLINCAGCGMSAITEIAPIVGTEQQAKDLISYIGQSRDDNNSIWDTNIFGKTVEQLVYDGIAGKIAMIGDDSQMRLQDTMQKIVNDSTGGFICIII